MNSSIFQSFCGLWKINRIIKFRDSNKAPLEGEGYALFKFSQSDTSQLLYYEIIKNIVPNLVGTQKYKYKLHDTKITKYFSDGRMFYSISFIDRNNAIGTHVCGNDTYEAIYRFDINSFDLKYIVNGPNKQHDILTQYDKSDSVSLGVLSDFITFEDF